MINLDCIGIINFDVVAELTPLITSTIMYFSIIILDSYSIWSELGRAKILTFIDIDKVKVIISLDIHNV